MSSVAGSVSGPPLPGFDEIEVKRAAEALAPHERPGYDLCSFLQWGTALAPYAATAVEDFGAELVVRELAFQAGWLAAEQLGLPSALFSLVPVPEAAMVGIVPHQYADALASVGSSAPALDRVAASLQVFALPPSWFGAHGPPEDAVLMRPSEPHVVDDGSADTVIGDLGRDRPLVYVTLGTTFADEPGLFRTVLDGAASLDVDVVAKTGPTVDPASLTGYGDHVRVVRYPAIARPAPLLSGRRPGRLRHVLRCHVPRVADGHGTDRLIRQPVERRQLARSGAAVAIPETSRSADAVADGLWKILEDPSYRRAAGVLRDELRAMPAPEAVVDSLEWFASTASHHD